MNADTLERPETLCLPALQDLLHELLEKGVRYCHWKSNLRLEKSLQGRTDLDLLVDSRHQRLFLEILGAHGAKPVQPAPGRDYPGTENYLGFDPGSGRMFHLHVHYQLVLGEQFVKNYTLPLERQFLDHTILLRGVRVPIPELELAVLSLRALLKYRDRDAVKDVLSICSPGLPGHILAEIRWLLGQTSTAQIQQTLPPAGAAIPVDVVIEFLQTVSRNPRAGLELYRLRRRTRQALRSHQRHNRWLAVRRYFREAWRRRAHLRLSPIQKMTRLDAGLTVALVGADGSGKSTMAKALSSWLNWKLDVAVYYLGSKAPSWQSKTLYTLYRMARRGHRTIARWFGNERATSRWIETLAKVVLDCHYLSIGYDRLRRYRAGQREAGMGSIVIYDRFPLDPVLDGARIQPEAGEKAGGVIRYLSAKEKKLYDSFQPPGCFCVLDVSPRVSLERKPDHSLETVQRKSAAIAALITPAGNDGQNARLIHIDADLPLDEVTRQLKANIWQLL